MARFEAAERLLSVIVSDPKAIDAAFEPRRP
jgi:hypothetical protein